MLCVSSLQGQLPMGRVPLWITEAWQRGEEMLCNWMKGGWPRGTEKISLSGVKWVDFQSQMVLLEPNPLRLLFRVGVTLEKRYWEASSGTFCVGPALASLFRTCTNPEEWQAWLYHHIFKFFKPVPKHDKTPPKALMMLYTLWFWLHLQARRTSGWRKPLATRLACSFLASEFFLFVATSPGNPCLSAATWPELEWELHPPSRLNMATPQGSQRALLKTQIRSCEYSSCDYPP